jgi:hypothetical protein
MPAVLPSPESSAEPGRTAEPSGVVGHVLWFLLAAGLVVNVPAFLCMGLHPDCSQWDLVTRAVLSGGAIYRDAAENNLPGMLLPLAVVRSVLGWSSEALRLADLVIVLTLTWLLVHWLPRSATRGQRLALAGALLAFYLSTSEWCHCQRDTWMLLPALLALSLRWRQFARLSAPSPSSRAVLATAFVEGLLWSVAFWIKPFVAVPGLLCWLLSARGAWRSAGGWKVALDGGAVLAGGLVSGAAGSAWLMATGAWPAFAETMFVWNQKYAFYDATEGELLLCLAGMLYRLFPWVLLHCIAVPVAFEQVRRALRAPGQPESDSGQTLLAGLYLGWLFQSACLQHLFDYVQVPAILLGIAVVAGRYGPASQTKGRGLVLALAVLCVLVRFPSICVHRGAAWGDCFRAGSTAELRDRLTLFPRTRWADLERVKDFLRDQEVKDGELSCLELTTLSLYEELGVRPATRFHVLTGWTILLSDRRDVLDGELAASRQRFVVCDVEGPGLEQLREALKEEAAGGAQGRSAAGYLWLKRIVFRSGQYLVFRVSGPETGAWLDATSKL